MKTRVFLAHTYLSLSQISPSFFFLWMFYLSLPQNFFLRPPIRYSLFLLVSTSSSSAQDEQYVHPSVDRRVCLKAGVKTRKTPTITATVSSTSPTLIIQVLHLSSNNNNALE